jgi:hypothetical protein
LNLSDFSNFLKLKYEEIWEKFFKLKYGKKTLRKYMRNKILIKI